MNTAIATGTGSYNGLGFAIPAGMVKNVVDQLIENGRVSRGYLGIIIADLPPKLAKTFGYDGRGVLVDNPLEDGPAGEAGIERGDIITKINGQAVDNPDELRRKVASIPPGTEMDVEIFRNGQYRTYEVTLAEFPEDPSLARGTSRSAPDQPKNKAQTRILRKLGFESVQTLTESLAKRLEIDYVPGVLVRALRPRSTAAEAGIRPKDIITNVMGVNVETIAQLVDELNKHDLTKGIRVSILHRDTPRFVFLELPKH